jgi:diguanylate cyclase (GGDEF)-like protein
LNPLRNISIKIRLLVSFLLAIAFPLIVFSYVLITRVELSVQTIIFVGIISILIAIFVAMSVASSIISPLYLIQSALQSFQIKRTRPNLKDQGQDEISEVAEELNKLFSNWNKEVVTIAKKQGKQDQEFEKNKYQMSLFEQQNSQTKTLLTIAKKLNTTFDFQANLKSILSEAVTSMNVQWASILLVNREKNIMTVACLHGIEQGLINVLEEKDYPSIRLRPHEGLAGLVIKEGLPIIANKGSKDVRFKPLTEFKENDRKIGSLLCAPIIGSDGAILGVLNLVNRVMPAVFRNEDLPFAGDLCTLASLVIERNRLYSNLFLDSKTGLIAHNVWKGYFNEEASRAQRYADTLALVIFEIDGFRELVLETSTEFIDETLAKCGKKLSDLLRDTDKGSALQERFYCLLPSADVAGSIYFIGRVKEAIEAEEFILKDKTYTISLSAGIANYPENTPEPEYLMENALAALSKAKRCTENKTVVFNS